MQATDLREKLRRLVGRVERTIMSLESGWRGHSSKCRTSAAVLHTVKDELAALLAESEPELEPCPDSCPECEYKSALLSQRLQKVGQPREAKAKLPLGHEFLPRVDGLTTCGVSVPVLMTDPHKRPWREEWRTCGQPCEAHEPPTGCSDGCGAFSDKHCWNGSDWTDEIDK